MMKSEISHRSFAEQCYALDENRLKISITTGKSAEKVYIVQGDPYLSGIMGGKGSWKGEKCEMTDVRLLENQKLWAIVITPEYKRLRYYFIIEGEGERLFCYDAGIFTESELEKMPAPQCFIMPWMNSSDIAVTPEWAQNMVWYQIFPERFCNGNSSINPSNFKKWKSAKVHFWDFYGGDLQGIISRLDYLQNLGINGIYLNPIFKSNSNHKYNTESYELIDPCFGDEETFKKLTSEAHKRGIRIMLDAVFNHSGWEFDKWQDVVKNGENSRYKDWFMVNSFPVSKLGSSKDNSFYTFAFTKLMPKLNTNNPEVADYLISLCKKWVGEWKIDGIRFDVGNEVSHRFLRKLRDEVKAVNPDVYLVGEIWHDSINWLMGDEYDSVMNYPLTEGLKRFFADDSLSSNYLEYHINKMHTMYPEQITKVLLNLFDSHDTIRLITAIDKNYDKFYQMFSMLFTLAGSTCIYYGTEIALEGSYDPDCRRCMPWSDIDKGKFSDITDKIKALVSIRKANESARSLDIKFIHSNNKRLVHYIKSSDDDIIEVIMNCSSDAENLYVNGEILFANKFSNGVLEKDGVVIIKTK